jgi:hypothetical protein
VLFSRKAYMHSLSITAWRSEEECPADPELCIRTTSVCLFVGGRSMGWSLRKTASNRLYKIRNRPVQTFKARVTWRRLDLTRTNIQTLTYIINYSALPARRCFTMSLLFSTEAGLSRASSPHISSSLFSPVLSPYPPSHHISGALSVLG